MANFRNKSAQEISDLLDEYEIKHGPVVDSTRSLYEKKLREAMTKKVRGRPSSDRTFYREEQEEITYVHYRTPLKNEHYEDRSSLYKTQASYGNMSHSKNTPRDSTAVASSSKETSTARHIPRWVQVLVFLIVVALLYFVFSNIESTQTSPFHGIE